MRDARYSATLGPPHGKEAFISYLALGTGLLTPPTTRPQVSMLWSKPLFRGDLRSDPVRGQETLAQQEETLAQQEETLAQQGHPATRIPHPATQNGQLGV